MKSTYGLVGGIANLLADQLVHPFGRLAAIVGLETWYYERHDVDGFVRGFGSGKGAVSFVIRSES